jgi:tetratricopeptide (TPR) repeat protein
VPGIRVGEGSGRPGAMPGAASSSDGSEGLRQRRGEPDANVEELLQNFSESLAGEEESKSRPGLSDDAKTIKDQLAEDPHNMELIWQLGQVYFRDGQLERVTNVLLRGWKRVSELKEKQARLDYLMLLAQVSIWEKKYKQALAVLNDTEESESEERSADFHMLRCQIYCFNGDTQKGLSSFNKAIDGHDFDDVLKIWSECIPAIKEVGAYDATKSTVEGKASTEQQKEKVHAIGRLAELQSMMGTESKTRDKPPTWMYALCAGLCVLMLVYLTYLESASLSYHRIK